jgi:hypothetical protein
LGQSKVSPDAVKQYLKRIDIKAERWFWSRRGGSGQMIGKNSEVFFALQTVKGR